MIATVKTMLSTHFIAYTNGQYTKDDINGIFTGIEDALNVIISKFNGNGFTMEQIVLKKATSVMTVVDTLNTNVDLINNYISALNSALANNYMLDKEILSVVGIDIVNNDAISTVEVLDRAVSVSMNNGQVVLVSSTSVSSTKGTETLSITHA